MTPRPPLRRFHPGLSLDDMRRWLAAHPDDHAARRSYARALRYTGCEAMAVVQFALADFYQFNEEPFEPEPRPGD